MAVNNPLRLAGSELRKMTDGELEDTSIQLRLAYAQRLFHCATPISGSNAGEAPDTNNNRNIVPGAIWSSGSGYNTWSNHTHRTLGSIADTYFPNVVTSRADNSTGGSGDSSGGASAAPDFADTPGALVSSTAVNYHFLQYLGSGSVHIKPDNDTKRTFGYIVSKGGADIAPETDDQNIVDTIFKHAHNEMLNGDGIGTYKIATSTPGSASTYDSWFNVFSNIYKDSYGSGSFPHDSTTVTTRNTYHLYLNLGDSYNYQSPGPILTNHITQQNQCLSYRNYTPSMHSGSASVTHGNQIDDYFLEGTYRGTVYIKAIDTNGTPGWNTDGGGTFTTLNLNSSPIFDTSNNYLGIGIRSDKFYPSGSSSDGYCRVWRNRALEKTSGFITGATYGVGLSDGNYTVNNVYKYIYEPTVTQYHITAPRETSAHGISAEHNPNSQSNIRRLGLTYNVLLPLFENTDPSGNYNFPVYSLSNNNIDNGSTIRQRGSVIDSTESSNSIRSNYLSGGTYYNVRYSSGSYSTVLTTHFNIETEIGVR